MIYLTFFCLIIFLVINFFYCIIYRNNKKFLTNRVSNYKLNLIFIFGIFIFHNLIFFLYKDYQYPKYIYGKAIDSISHYYHYKNYKNEDIENLNVHDYLETRLGNQGRAAYDFSLSEQNETLKKIFNVKKIKLDYFEDPELSYLYLLNIIDFFKSDITLQDLQIFLLIINFLSIVILYFIVKNIFSASISIIFNLMILFFLPIYNLIFSLYHHYILFPSLVLSLFFIYLFIIDSRYKYLFAIIFYIFITFGILVRTSTVLIIPISALLLLFYNKSIFKSILILLVFIPVFLMISSNLKKMYFIESVDKFDSYSHVIWYTFYTGLGETNKLVEGADDGYGFELAREKIPDIKKMSKDWDNFFFNESYELIKNNKKDYFLLIVYRINKILGQKNNNWEFINLKFLKVVYELLNYIAVLLVCLIFFNITFKKRRELIYEKIIFISIIPIAISFFHILFFAKNYYYYFLFNIFIFILVAILLDYFYKKLFLKSSDVRFLS